MFKYAQIKLVLNLYINNNNRVTIKWISFHLHKSIEMKPKQQPNSIFAPQFFLSFSSLKRELKKQKGEWVKERKSSVFNCSFEKLLWIILCLINFNPSKPAEDRHESDLRTVEIIWFYSIYSLLLNSYQNRGKYKLSFSFEILFHFRHVLSHKFVCVMSSSYNIKCQPQLKWHNHRFIDFQMEEKKHLMKFVYLFVFSFFFDSIFGNVDSLQAQIQYF